LVATSSAGLKVWTSACPLHQFEVIVNGRRTVDFAGDRSCVAQLEPDAADGHEPTGSTCRYAQPAMACVNARGSANRIARGEARPHGCQGIAQPLAGRPCPLVGAHASSLSLVWRTVDS
jgi:hypothetical protein